MNQLEILKENRAKLLAKMQYTLDKAENEKRALTVVEENEYQNMERDLQMIDEEIKSFAGRSTTTQIDNKTKYRFAGNKKGNGYGDIFTRYLIYGEKGLSPKETMLLEDRSIEKRALQVDSDGAGGYLVPQQLANDVIQDLNKAVVVRDISRKMTVENAQSFHYPTVNTNMGDLTWTAELGTGSNDDDLDFGQRAFYPHPLARKIKLSKTLLRRAGVDVAGIVREQFAYKLGTVQENAFCIGSGVNQPLGLFTASSAGLDASRDTSQGSTATTATYDSFTYALEKISPMYRKNLKWLISPELQGKTLRLKSGDGLPLWQANLQTGIPSTILGYPVVLSSFVPTDFTTGTYCAILGNFDYYLVVDALTMEIQVLTELYAETNQNGYICRIETDANVLLPSAFARMKLS